jgi:hypothetical protein
MCCARDGLRGTCPVMVPRIGRVRSGLRFGLGLRAGDPRDMSSARAGRWAIWVYVRCSSRGLGMCCARAGLRGRCPVMVPRVGRVRSGLTFGLGLRAGDPGACPVLGPGSGQFGSMSVARAGGWACAALRTGSGAHVRCSRRGLGMCGLGACLVGSMAEAGPDIEVRPGFRVVGFRALQGARVGLRCRRRGSHCG